MKWLAFGLALVPQMALALSCLRPDVARTYGDAAESGSTYVVMHGRLNFDERLLNSYIADRVSGEDLPPVPARMTGAYLNEDGFTGSVTLDLSILVRCAGAWCGSAAKDQDVIAFLEVAEDGSYTLTENACPHWAFYTPRASDISRLEACMAGGPCQDEGY